MIEKKDYVKTVEVAKETLKQKIVEDMLRQLEKIPKQSWKKVSRYGHRTYYQRSDSYNSIVSGVERGIKNISIKDNGFDLYFFYKYVIRGGCTLSYSVLNSNTWFIDWVQNKVNEYDLRKATEERQEFEAIVKKMKNKKYRERVLKEL